MTDGTSITATSAISTALAPTGHPHPLLADGGAREHGMRLASVLIGRTPAARPVGPAAECWPVGDMGAFSFEAYYDPERISLADAETQVRTQLAEQGVQVARFLNEDDPQVTEDRAVRDRMLSQWGEFRSLARERGTATPAMEKFMDEVALLISVSPDPQATVDAVIDVISRERAKNRACRTYAWCDSTGPHYDHGRHETGIVAYGATHLSEGQPTLYVGQDEFPPGQAAAKAAELRAVADRIEAMAAGTKARK
jgi:hypothetical protein